MLLGGFGERRNVGQARMKAKRKKMEEKQNKKEFAAGAHYVAQAEANMAQALRDARVPLNGDFDDFDGGGGGEAPRLT
jgi:hypothetical protein